jgi:tetratricopeptide (TPR) repeat protein
MQDRISQLLRFLDEDPNDPFLLFALAQEYAGTGARDKALGYYLQLREAHPEHVATYYHLGMLYEAVKSPEEAADTYARGIEVAQEQGDSHALKELRAAAETLTSRDE